VSQQDQRNDAKALRIIVALWAEGVSADNIVRLLNYHFEPTYVVSVHNRIPSIMRVPEGHNYAPNVTVWSPTK